MICYFLTTATVNILSRDTNRVWSERRKNIFSLRIKVYLHFVTQGEGGKKGGGENGLYVANQF